MADYRTDPEEEPLFLSYPYALYFIQSPASSAANHPPSPPLAFALSGGGAGGYSPSRGSDDSFLKKLYDDGDAKVRRGDGHGDFEEGLNDGDVRVDDTHRSFEYSGDEDDGGGGGRRKRGWIQYFSFGYSDSGWWILLQLSWRFLFSFLVAVLVFYAAVKPPPPAVSVKVARIRQFRVAEGVDGRGVATSILTCNSTVAVVIDNTKSKLFDLHIHTHPPLSLQILFANLPLAASHPPPPPPPPAAANDVTRLILTAGTKNLAVYGAGREMQELLNSGKGLPLQIRLSFTSSFHVVRGMIDLKFRHDASCLVVVFADKYDRRRRTHRFNSTCVVARRPL
ncbi:uncharacterized protein LOC127245284 [Andrographis paniculata]|uniref:uncharacterized protein LOC127245284 n=1 Tax=Andrographis paniculata TaxID=175694 RepID=UPI0021E701AE|nr:uncharacterized protein LOC127245284 [Andrographis paniculata]